VIDNVQVARWTRSHRQIVYRHHFTNFHAVTRRHRAGVRRDTDPTGL